MSLSAMSENVMALDIKGGQCVIEGTVERAPDKRNQSSQVNVRKGEKILWKCTTWN